MDKMDAEWQALAKSIQREVARQDIADNRKRRFIQNRNFKAHSGPGGLLTNIAPPY